MVVVVENTQHASTFIPSQQDARPSCRSLRHYGERVPVRTGWINAYHIPLQWTPVLGACRAISTSHYGQDRTRAARTMV
jgi:hypothetical protein